MSKVINLVAGDTGPTLTFTLTDKSTGNPIDLTNMSTANLKMRLSLSATAPGGTPNPVITSIPMTVLGLPTAGQLTVAMNATMAAQPAGSYQGEVDLVMTGGQIVTIFDTVLFNLRARF